MVRPRLATGPSPIHGTGLFATAPIPADDVVMIWGGTVWTRTQLDAGLVPPCSVSFVDDDVLLAAPADGLDYLVTHSCDPSVWMAGWGRWWRGAPSGRATRSPATTRSGRPRRTIASRSARTCGTAACRGVVRGTDWQRPEHQKRYAGHFLPSIERRFRQRV